MSLSFRTNGNFIDFVNTDATSLQVETVLMKLHNTSRCIDWSLPEDTTKISFTIDEVKYSNIPISEIDFDGTVMNSQDDFETGITAMFEGLASGSPGGGVESVTGDLVGGTGTNPTVNRGYKVYRAKVSQADATADLTTHLNQDTIGFNEWERYQAGGYENITDLDWPGADKIRIEGDQQPYCTPLFVQGGALLKYMYRFEFYDSGGKMGISIEFFDESGVGIDLFNINSSADYLFTFPEVSVYP